MDSAAAAQVSASQSLPVEVPRKGLASAPSHPPAPGCCTDLCFRTWTLPLIGTQASLFLTPRLRAFARAGA